MSGKCTVASQALKAQARAIKKNLKPLQKADSDAIHDMRVASRRLRAVLTELRSSFDPKQAEPLRKKARKITRNLGRARELDVSIALLETLDDEFKGKPATVHLAEFLLKERGEEDAAVAKAAKLAGSKKFTAAIKELAAGGDSCRIRQAAKSTTARYEGVVAAYNEWHAKSTSETLHALRVALKKFRYTCEIFADLYGKPMKTFIKSLKEIQETLGQWHDYSVLKNDIEKAKAAAPKKAQPGMEALAQAVQQKEDDILQKFTTQAAKFFDEKQQEKARKLFTHTHHCQH